MSDERQQSPTRVHADIQINGKQATDELDEEEFDSSLSEEVSRDKEETPVATVNAEQTLVLEAKTLDEKQAEVLDRLAKVRDCKRQVLEMLDQMKQQQPDVEKLDKEVMAKLIRTFDGFVEQEEKYAEILRDILAMRKAQANAAAREAQQLKLEIEKKKTEEKPEETKQETVDTPSEEAENGDNAEMKEQFLATFNQSPQEEAAHIDALREQRDKLRLLLAKRKEVAELQQAKARLAAESQADSNEQQAYQVQVSAERESIANKQAQLDALREQVTSIRAMMAEVQNQGSPTPEAERAARALNERLAELEDRKSAFGQLLQQIDEEAQERNATKLNLSAQSSTPSTGGKQQEDIDELNQQLSTHRSDYARKLREQQSALDSLMQERQRLDQMQREHKAQSTMPLSARPPSVPRQSMPKRQVHSARGVAPAMSSSDEESVSSMQLSKHLKSIQRLFESKSSSREGSMRRRAQNRSSRHRHEDSDIERASSVMSASNSITPETNLILWQQQMLTTQMMQQQLHQQAMIVQSLQDQMRSSMPPGSSRETPVRDTTRYNYPIPPAMLSAYSNLPLSNHSLANIFTQPSGLVHSMSSHQIRSTTPQHQASSRMTPVKLSSSRRSTMRASSAQPENMGVRENLYNEVATLIAQNEDSPQYLVDLFRELQMVSNTNLRQQTMEAIRNLLKQHHVNPGAEQLSASSIERSFLRGRAHTDDSAAEFEHVDEAAQNGLDDSTEDIVASVGEHLKSVLQPYRQQKTTPQMLSFVRKNVVAMAASRTNASSETSQFLCRQLNSILDDTLANYADRQLADCYDDLVTDVNDAVYNELAFYRMMNNMQSKAASRKHDGSQSDAQ